MTNSTSHTPFLLVSKSTTPRAADVHSSAEKMRLLEPTTKTGMKIGPYYQRQNCRPMTTFWRYKIYADIRRGSVGRGRQTTVGLSRTVISAFTPLVISSETLEMRTALLYDDMQTVVKVFSDPKMHDLE